MFTHSSGSDIHESKSLGFSGINRVTRRPTAFSTKSGERAMYVANNLAIDFCSDEAGQSYLENWVYCQFSSLVSIVIDYL